jgi:hypothetical protein
MVPVPLDFHPALVTVITMSPESAYMANTLICPGYPAAKVAVSAAAVEKYDVVKLKLAAAVEARSSELGR